MIGKIFVTIKKTNGEEIKEAYTDAMEVDSWSATDKEIKQCMLDALNNSPYSFNGNAGGSLIEDNGNVWTFEFVEV